MADPPPQGLLPITPQGRHSWERVSTAVWRSAQDQVLDLDHGMVALCLARGGLLIVDRSLWAPVQAGKTEFAVVAFSVENPGLRKCLDCVDAAITSIALRRLGCRVGLVSNDLGNDADGRALPHDIQLASTAGAGATFSAGLIYGRVQSWTDDQTVAFANALATLFCSAPDGISSSSATEVLEWAAARDVQLTKLL